jgi:LacI family transcriptional regulator
VKATRDDVAARAKVSTATVSRVYNTPESVSPDKRARVLAAAGELGYIPDKNASALRRSSTGTIALLEHRGSIGIHGGIYRWFYHDMMRGIREILDRTMYQLNIFAFDSPRDVRNAPPGALGDGVIAHGAEDRRLIAALRQRSHAYVCCGQTEGPRGVNCSYTDNILGGREAARVFLEAGCTKPAHVTGGLEGTGACKERWEGFRSGMSGREVALVDGALGVEGGHQSGKKLVPRVRAGKIDSLFVVNDLTAVGVMQAMLEAGVRIPRQLSIIGYDNLPVIETLPQRLSTIDIAFGEVYARATTRLLDHIRTGERIREQIQPVYVAGETVA